MFGKKLCPQFWEDYGSVEIVWNENEAIDNITNQLALDVSPNDINDLLLLHEQGLVNKDRIEMEKH